MAVRSSRKKSIDPRVTTLEDFIEHENDRDIPSSYRCTRCGLVTTRSDVSKFPVNYSQIYASNDYRVSVCKDCMDDLYENFYFPKYKNDAEAMRVMCQKFDYYYCEDLVLTALSIAKPKKKFSAYIQKATLQQYANKTYDNTIDEEKEKALNVDKFEDMDKNEVSEDTVRFWGFGYSPEDYEYLDNRYVSWSTSYNINSEAMSTIFRNICAMELQIQKGIQCNDKIDNLYKTLNDYMNAAGIQPKQSSENTLSDSASFGVLIKRWEDEKPIPEPEPEWKDVDGIIQYISVWFFGHLCKMFGFKNQWADKYEQELQKYSAQKPDLNSADLDTVSYDDIFGKQGDDFD